jgi:phage-related protein
MNQAVKQIAWVGSSWKDLKAMPDEVQDAFGYALHLAQIGKKGNNVKPLRGFGSAGVLEVVENDDGNAYRAVYTVRFESAVYVLHCFQKKSVRGIETPKPDIDLIQERLKAAETHAKGKTK